MQQTKLTVEQHVELGTELLAMDKQIHALALRLSSTYGSTSAQVKHATKLRNVLLNLRSDMELQLMRDHVGFQPVTHVYFGTDAAREHAGVVAKTPQPA